MDYGKVKTNDDLSISAEQFNGWQDAAVFARSQTTGVTGGVAKRYPRNASTIMVQNVSGAAVDAFHIMALKEPVVIPDSGSNLDSTDSATNEFRNRVLMAVDKPTGGDEGSWCVLTEPLADQAWGWAVVSGITPCWLNLASTSDRLVDAESNSTIAKSGDEGQRIVWVRGGVGTATTTGEQWAVILLGGGAAASDKGQYMGQVKMMVSQNQTGWDYPKAHSM